MRKKIKIFFRTYDSFIKEDVLLQTNIYLGNKKLLEIFMELSQFILRLGVALLFGGAVGFERQWRLKSAGLRTNALVSLGSAAYILLSLYINNEEGGDAGRVAAQIVTGIGFLGAGVIMKDGMSIQGLNTAATIWCSAAVGSLAGMGMFPESFVVTAAIIITHLVMRPVSDKLGKISAYKKGKKDEFYYILTIFCSADMESKVKAYLIHYLDSSDKYLLRSMARKPAEGSNKIRVQTKFATVGRQESMLEQIIEQLTMEMQVDQASWAYVEDDI